MKPRRTILTAVAALLMALPAAAFGHASYTGYSGAPGARGTCASSCHGGSGGTIAVTGFPVTYDPGMAYTVTVRHTGGSSISNFNASVRIGTSSSQAGAITAGLNTSTYAVNPQEPNGVHFASANKDSGQFTWTAPSPGVGDVTLYLGGLQGTSSGGPNTRITLTATQSQSGVQEDPDRAVSPVSLSLENRVVTDYLVLRVVTRAEIRSQLKILDLSGRRVASIDVMQTGSPQTMVWEPLDRNGQRLSPGSYFAILAVGNRRLIRKFALVQ